MRPFTVEDVVWSAQAACIIEAGVDKPGNVGPSHDFEDTGYRDFILSGVAIGDAVKEAVEFGAGFEKGRVGLGALIKKAVADGLKSHGGGNTNLGIAMLLIPLAASAGLCIRDRVYSLQQLRRGVSTVIEGSTPQDTLELYDAIVLSDAEVGRSPRFDVKDPRSRERVVEKGLNLHRVFRISSWDSISRELVSGMEVTATTGYPALKEELERTGDLRGAVLRCFFEILGRVPDTLIERKNTREAAVRISEEARAILEKGLLPGDVARFDRRLRKDGNRFNPGTTADLTASSLMVALLEGLL
ncbi:MAG: ATP--dephospho-CoA triphosphoribosyl transferase CitG [Methanobacteriota archaeon]|nr:MAG: ATP--dephospho-CoA triphosphoribosyl transferase CitG [Euryarchaeota archaeon]